MIEWPVVAALNLPPYYNWSQMIVIGITGNIGSGKSTVCHILSKLGAIIIDADKLGHQAYRPYSSTWHELINYFGRAIVMENDEIDRHKLGQLAFSSQVSLVMLNRIVHPQIYKEAQQRISYYRRQQVGAVALEATLLIEAGWQDLVDITWLVITSREKMIQRLSNDKKNTEAQILARLESQMPVKEKMQYADELIHNDGDLSQLEARIKELWQKLPPDIKAINS
jgi:dephospho-CoA kinase